MSRYKKGRQRTVCVVGLLFSKICSVCTPAVYQGAFLAIVTFLFLIWERNRTIPAIEHLAFFRFFL